MIRSARQLLTLQGPPGPRRGWHMKELAIIQDGAVLIVDGIISHVGSSRRVEALPESRNAIEINAAGRVVMPGFVDCHTHLIGAPLHSVGSGRRPDGDVRFSNLIQTTSRFTLEAQGQRALDEFVRHGTTMVESKSGQGLSRKAEMKILRAQATLAARTTMLVSTFTAARWLPLAPPDEFMEFLCTDVLPIIRRRRLAEFADIECDRGAFGPEQARKYYAAARKLGFRVKLQTGREMQTGAIVAALQSGAASIDDLNDASFQEASLLAIGSAIATLLPCPTFHAGGDKYAPARRLIDGGAAVALATDFDMRTSATQNMQTAVGLACRKMEMTVEEAISAATINGAHAMRRADRLGSIEYGKRADILLLALPDYREMSYHFGVNVVDTTIKSGRVVFHRAKVQWPAA